MSIRNNGTGTEARNPDGTFAAGNSERPKAVMASIENYRHVLEATDFERRLQALEGDQ